MKKSSYLSLAALIGAAACSSAVQTPGAPAGQSSNQAPVPAQLPLKHTAEPTVAAITPRDLMTRLYIFADDSMMGRQIGTHYNDMGTQYIANEVRKLGLKPAGDNGTYFQNIHAFIRAIDSTSTLSVDGQTFKVGKDFVVNVPNVLPASNTSAFYYWGARLDTVNMPTEEDLHNKYVLFGPTATNIQIATPEQQKKFSDSNGYKEYVKRLGAAAGIPFIQPAITPALAASQFTPLNTANHVRLLGDKQSSYSINMTQAVVNAAFGGPLSGVAAKTTSKPITFNIKYNDKEVPGRNVVAILPGSDPKLRNTYVAIGAHNDHVGFCSRLPNPERACSNAPLDHDSIRAWLTVIQTGGAEGPYVAANQVKPEQWARINAIKDSLHALHGVRMDSIFNGADDDGTGSMGVLEIAQAFATSSVRPKRSLIFVWHVGEEKGMYGSNYFTDHPTVPRDSIVAQLNVDMIGRGSPGDEVPWGGPTYLQLIGSRRLSTELGDIVEQVNTDTHAGFKYDYQFDANGDSHNYYCRSDHWAYARYGIPITFFTTGGHRDYHQLTDEPQYIDYNHYAHVAQLIHDIAVRVADLDHRPVVDKQKGDPYGTCKQ